MGEPFWFRLGRGREKQKELGLQALTRSQLQPSQTHPSVRGKAEQQPFRGWVHSGPALEDKADRGRKEVGGTSERLQPAGSRVPQGQPSVCVRWGGGLLIPGTCPTGGWCSEGEAPASAGCSSNGRQTAGIPPRTS